MLVWEACLAVYCTTNRKQDSNRLAMTEKCAFLNADITCHGRQGCPHKFSGGNGALLQLLYATAHPPRLIPLYVFRFQCGGGAALARDNRFHLVGSTTGSATCMRSKQVCCTMCLRACMPNRLTVYCTGHLHAALAHSNSGARTRRLPHDVVVS